MVSGGLDSALMYYLIHKINEEGGRSHKIQPFIMPREDGSKIYAYKVINYVHNLFNIHTEVQLIGNTTLPDDKQISSAIRQIADMQDGSVTYIGAIEVCDIHAIGWGPVLKVTDTENIINPFKNLYKSHIIDVIKQLGQEELFNITHSCIYPIRCKQCLSCQEREWGFKEMNLLDTGNL